MAGSDQLDQWLVAHPDELLTRAPEPAVVNPANPYVLDPHLRCAAHELPLSHADERWWPGLLDDAVRRLVHADELAVRRRGRRREPIAVWMGTGWPSHGVGLRNAAGAPVRIVTREGERPIGDVDRARAPEQVHAGASYLHQGQHWRVVELDLDVGRGAGRARRRRHLHRARGATRRSGCSTAEREREVGRAHLHLGTVEVHTVGGGLPAQGRAHRRGHRHGAARPARRPRW